MRLRNAKAIRFFLALPTALIQVTLAPGLRSREDQEYSIIPTLTGKVVNLLDDFGKYERSIVALFVGCKLFGRVTDAIY